MKKLRNLATSSSIANPFGLLSSPSNPNKPFYFGESPEAPPRRVGPTGGKELDFAGGVHSRNISRFSLHVRKENVNVGHIS